MFFQLQPIFTILFTASISFLSSTCVKVKNKKSSISEPREKEKGSSSISMKPKENPCSPESQTSVRCTDNVGNFYEKNENNEKATMKVSREAYQKPSKEVEAVKSRGKAKEQSKRKEIEKKSEEKKKTSENSKSRQETQQSSKKEIGEKSIVKTAEQPRTIMKTVLDKSTSMKATQQGTTTSVSRRKKKKSPKLSDKSYATTLPREKRGYHKDIIAEQEALLAKMMDEKSEDKDDEISGLNKTQDPPNQ